MQYLLISVTLIVALTVLSACAPPAPVLAPSLPPPSQEALAADTQRAELFANAEKAKKEFLDNWSRWNAKAKALHTDLEAINQEAALIANHPGWSDMAQILKSFASIRHLEGEESAMQKRTVALTQWSQRWKANGREIYEKSRFLLNRIVVANATFQPLEKDYEGIYGLYAIWTFLESVANRTGSMEPAFKIGDDLFLAPSRKMWSELNVLLKKPLITLGLAL